MSTKLYEEAIAEAKQLRDLAEQNAKNAIIEAVTPKIKSFIEDQLLGNDSTDQDESSIMEDLASELSGDDDEIELSESEIGALMGLVSESSQKEALEGLISKVGSTGKEKKMANNDQGEYLEIDLDDNLLNEGAHDEAAEDGMDEYSLEEIVAMLEGEGDEGSDGDEAAHVQEDPEEGMHPSMEETLDDAALEELAEAILRMELDLGDDVELPEDFEADVSVELAEDEEEEGEDAPMDDMPADDAADSEDGEEEEGEDEPSSLDDLLESATTITIRESDLRKEIRNIKLAMEKQANEKLAKLKAFFNNP